MNYKLEIKKIMMKLQTRKSIVQAVRKAKGLTTNLDDDTIYFIISLTDEEFDTEVKKLVEFKNVS